VFLDPAPDIPDPSTEGPRVVNAKGEVEIPAPAGSCDLMALGDRAARALGGDEMVGSLITILGELVDGAILVFDNVPKVECGNVATRLMFFCVAFAAGVSRLACLPRC
jgi:hypothetical protein